jgi:hypothetical protein
MAATLAVDGIGSGDFSLDSTGSVLAESWQRLAMAGTPVYGAACQGNPADPQDDGSSARCDWSTSPAIAAVR